MAKLEIIEGIGPVYAQKLREAGISTIETLLETGATPEGREEIQEATGIGVEFILDWVNRADLMRIRGVGPEYSDLLEKGGVDTVVELAQRNPENLFQKLIEVNTEKRLVRRPPSRSMVEDWVRQAESVGPYSSGRWRSSRLSSRLRAAGPYGSGEGRPGGTTPGVGRP